MWRWLLLPLGLAVAAFAAWTWLAAPGGPPAPGASSGSPAASPRARSGGPGADAGAPLGHIDEDSRRRLERVLEQEGVE
jgi:hypothetical protein